MSFHHVLLLVPVQESHDPSGNVSATILLGQNDFFGHMILVLASYDTDGIMTGTTSFIPSRQLEQGAIFHVMILLALALASHDTDSIINTTISFFRSRQMKRSARSLVWSYDTTGTSISVT